jgi:hypothetical protein
MRGEERELKEIAGGLLRDGLNSLRPVTMNNSPRPGCDSHLVQYPGCGTSVFGTIRSRENSWD